MVRILENGKYRAITCACGCKFSFDLTDLDKNNKIKCPECEAENTAQVKATTKSK